MAVTCVSSVNIIQFSDQLQLKLGEGSKGPECVQIKCDLEILVFG